MTLKDKPATRGLLAAAAGITAAVLGAFRQLSLSPWSIGAVVFTGAIIAASAALPRGAPQPCTRRHLTEVSEDDDAW